MLFARMIGLPKGVTEAAAARLTRCAEECFLQLCWRAIGNQSTPLHPLLLMVLMLQVRAVPLRKGDEVKIVRGSVNAKGREGKVIAVYRKKFVIHVERVTREKVNGQPVPIPIQASNVIITKLNMDKDVAKDRKALLTRKAAGRSAANAMAEVD